MWGYCTFFTLRSLGTLAKFFYVFFENSFLPDYDVLSIFLIVATDLWFAYVEKDLWKENSWFTVIWG